MATSPPQFGDAKPIPMRDGIYILAPCTTANGRALFGTKCDRQNCTELWWLGQCSRGRSLRISGCRCSRAAYSLYDSPAIAQAAGRQRTAVTPPHDCNWSAHPSVCDWVASPTEAFLLSTPGWLKKSATPIFHTHMIVGEEAVARPTSCAGFCDRRSGISFDRKGVPGPRLICGLARVG